MKFWCGVKPATQPDFFLKHPAEAEIFTKAGQAVSFCLANRYPTKAEPVVLATSIIHELVSAAKKYFLIKNALSENFSERAKRTQGKSYKV